MKLIVYISLKKSEVFPYFFFCKIISVQMGSVQHISKYKSGCLYIQIGCGPFHSGGPYWPQFPYVFLEIKKLNNTNIPSDISLDQFKIPKQGVKLKKWPKVIFKWP